MANETQGTAFYGVATVGERGQIVIPAEARRAYGIEPGEKLMILSHPSGRALLLARASDFLHMIDQVQELIASVTQAAAAEPPKGDDR